MRRWLAALGCLYMAGVVGAQSPERPGIGLETRGGVAVRPTTIPPYAWLLHSTSGAPREARSDILDTPVLPGSLIKAVTLVAAIESETIRPDTTHMCRRTVTVDGRRYTCSHPDPKRPL